MFGLSSNFIQSQVVLPVSYAVSQYSAARASKITSKQKTTKCLKQNVSENSVKAIAPESNDHIKCTENDSTKKCILSVLDITKNEVFSNILEVKEISNIITKEVLKDCALYGISPNRIPSLLQLRNYSQLSGRRSTWHSSHSSLNSFTENKIGYPNEVNIQSTLIRTILADSWNKNFTSSLMLDLRRGFHTQQSIERKTLQLQSMSNRLRSGLKAKDRTLQLEGETKHKLNSLLTEETSEEAQKNLKIAFAEGYLASDPKKSPSKFMKLLQNFQSIVAFLTIVTLLVFLWGGMGGSMFRMHVGNGNEVHPEEITVSFDDVRGVEEAKQELQEIVQFLKNPEKFTSLGAELPKGVLLVGPPGTGKTLLARAVAGEAGVPFFHAAGPEFDEILVGQGARRVRDLFLSAKMRAPCVIFIDEIDSVGAKRTNSVLHPYANQTINQLLAEMDGFHKNEGVIVLGATNRRDDLDKALLRPGRFDVEVQVPIPDLAGRKEIFDYYLGKVKIAKDIDRNVLARGTTGFTGADIKNVVNQAALRAAADHVECVSLNHLEEARDKVLMGPERKSRIPDEEANLLTAFHESGHTLVAYYTKDSHPLHKVTIIPRGPSLGHTAYIPAKEQYHMTRSQMLAMMDSLMGGRAAEELIFGTEMITSGASSDLKQATSIASHMVKDLGMSDRVGLRTFENNSNQILKSGDSLGQSTKEAIDGEIRRILQESYERAKAILKGHAKEHKALADALMKYETLDAQDIKSILEGRPVTKSL